MANNNLAQQRQRKSGAGTLPERQPETAAEPKGEGRAKGPLTGKPLGRNKLPPEEKRSYKVLLSLTEEEGATLRENADLVKDATFIYHFLKTNGFFEPRN